MIAMGEPRSDEMLKHAQRSQCRRTRQTKSLSRQLQFESPVIHQAAVYPPASFGRLRTMCARTERAVPTLRSSNLSPISSRIEKMPAGAPRTCHLLRLLQPVVSVVRAQLREAPVRIALHLLLAEGHRRGRERRPCARPVALPMTASQKCRTSSSSVHR